MVTPVVTQVTRKEFDALVSRVKALEDYIAPMPKGLAVQAGDPIQRKAKRDRAAYMRERRAKKNGAAAEA